MQTTVFALAKFLHDLATAVWVGGLIVLAAVVLPASRAALGPGPQTKRLMAAVQRRLSLLVYASIVLLLLTGALQANRSPAFGGLFSFGNSYSTVLSLKHLLVVAMVVVALYRSLALGRRHEALAPAQEKLNVVLLIANAAMGVVVLLLSGVAAALA